MSIIYMEYTIRNYSTLPLRSFPTKIFRKGGDIMAKTQHFGRIVRERREALGLSIEDAAALCKMSYKGLEGIELGDSYTRLSSVLNIAATLDIDLGELNSCVPVLS